MAVTHLDSIATSNWTSVMKTLSDKAGIGYADTYPFAAYVDRDHPQFETEMQVLQILHRGVSSVQEYFKKKPVAGTVPLCTKPGKVDL